MLTGSCVPMSAVMLESLMLQVTVEPLPPTSLDLLKCLARGWTYDAYMRRRSVSRRGLQRRIEELNERLCAPTLGSATFNALAAKVITVAPTRPSMRLSFLERIVLQAVAVGWRNTDHERWHLHPITRNQMSRWVNDLRRKMGAATLAHMVVLASSQGFLLPEMARPLPVWYVATELNDPEAERSTFPNWPEP